MDEKQLIDWIDFGIFEAERQSDKDLIKSISYNSEGLRLLTHDGKEFVVVVREIE